MIDFELELDTALSRLSDAEEQIDGLQQEAREKDDAIAALLRGLGLAVEELGAMERRCADLELQLASRRPA